MNGCFVTAVVAVLSLRFSVRLLVDVCVFEGDELVPQRRRKILRRQVGYAPGTARR